MPGINYDHPGSDISADSGTMKIDGAAAFTAADGTKLDNLGKKGTDLPSGTPTVPIDGDYFDATGSTAITAFIVAADRHFFTQFDVAIQLTHHATNLDLPSEANITTAVGDVAEWFSTGANTCQCVNYTKADGTAVVGTKEFFVPIFSEGQAFPYTFLTGAFPTISLSAAEPINLAFFVPNDFSTLIDATILINPDTSETVQWDVTTQFAANGEANNANTDSITDATLAVTLNQLAELDVSAALTGLAANDYVGMLFESNTTAVFIIGLRIKYS